MAASCLGRLAAPWAAPLRRHFPALPVGGLRRCEAPWSPSLSARRSYQTTRYGGRYFVTMLPGHGIGPEMMNHVENVFFQGKSEGAHSKRSPSPAGSGGLREDHDRRDDGEASSMNYAITENVEDQVVQPQRGSLGTWCCATRLDLYVNVVHCRNHPGIRTRHPNIDIVVIRQNTEGEYSCLEHEVGATKSSKDDCFALSSSMPSGALLMEHFLNARVTMSSGSDCPEKDTHGRNRPFASPVRACLRSDLPLRRHIPILLGDSIAVHPGIVESLKIITLAKSQQIARYAFEYARSHKRKKVTVVHKANIMKLTDGLFLETCRQVARDYPDVAVNDMIVDNCSMQLVSNPGQFDILLVPNLYGNIVVNLACGLTGGAGVTSGRNYGDKYAVFETATRNTGTALVGKNLANPVATLNAAVDMLKHLGLMQQAYVIRDAIRKTINDYKIHTLDLGGTATTTDVVNSVIAEVRKNTP
ncbi:hypothetical protein HPB48_008779 [Haemaphysalis longicornis]|uniref:Isopropylmalate dehydrogenase-like domain-containing protein n=1 Tax=Haemaphysalis longicornis TaxID=44386 RepID=A0A9J6FWG6_HAELO|nr:hypothetical protein HPB48_008779 [Haemaphysalis longicornis]